MIFEAALVCNMFFCREPQENTGAIFPNAPFVAVLVSRGKIGFVQEGKELLLQAGDIILTRGTLEAKAAYGSHMLACGLCGSAAEAAGRKLGKPLAISSALCPLAPQLLRDIADAAARGDADALAILCYRLLCEVASVDEAAAPRLSPLVADAERAIRKNYAGLYGVEELSTQLGVSKSHLVRMFSAEMNTPPGQYLTHIRVEAAKQLLTHRGYTLEVIATLCGFSGANYFCKVFKRTTGKTPIAWRSENSTPAERMRMSEAESSIYV